MVELSSRKVLWHDEKREKGFPRRNVCGKGEMDLGRSLTREVFGRSRDGGGEETRYHVTLFDHDRQGIHVLRSDLAPLQSKLRRTWK